jgi:AmmeMemoRadiSam system protein A
MTPPLTPQEKATLLKLARASILAAVRREKPPVLEDREMTDALLADGASFVTLTKHGALCGCIGALEPYQPLAADVREHAAAAALEDYRFPNMKEAELPEIAIEISRLTPPRLLEYKDADDLLAKLTPGKDGVILRDSWRRATFLPQVWEKIPDKGEFLANLCYKMGAQPDAWRKKHLEVLLYQVEEFHE